MPTIRLAATVYGSPEVLASLPGPLTAERYAYIKSLDRHFSWVPADNTTADNVTVIAPTGGASGRWLVVADEADISSAVTRVVYREGEPSPSGYVFGTWLLAAAALAPLKGRKAIVCDSRIATCHITGSVDLDHADIVGATALTNVTIDSGATIANPGTIRDLNITCNAVSPITITNPVIVYVEGTEVNNPATGHALFAMGTNTVLDMKLSSGFNGPHEAVTSSGSGFHQLALWSGSYTSPGTVAGTTGQLIQYLVDPSVDAEDQSSTFTGTNTIERGNYSTNVDFDPATPSNWNSPPNNPSDALNELAARVKALE